MWSYDGRILYCSANNGYRDELALYDNTFQPDGQNWVMNADGSNKRQITDTIWEEAMPLYLPANVSGGTGARERDGGEHEGQRP